MNNKCIKCGVKGDIFLTNDNHCSVCNAKYKDRKRVKTGMDNFVKTKKLKEGKYNHLSSIGRKLTEYEKTKDKYGGTVVGNYMVHKIIEAKKRRITEFI